MLEKFQVTLLMKETKNAFDNFIDSGFDKSSRSLDNYKAFRNKKNNAIRDAKKAAMGNILNDPSLSKWEKIRIFKGTNTDPGKIEELEIDGTKCTENLKIANGLNEFFSTIGAKLNDQARVSSQVNDTNVSAIDPCTLAIPKFAFEIVNNNEVSRILQTL